MAPKIMRKMKNAVALFKIPAKKLSRAKTFYESIFDIKMEDMEMDNDCHRMFACVLYRQYD
ncbi:hypothetical protein [Fodinibius sp. SL11]|uniref:hypothetical protein n=1 Tax=Fodinibius sp. SL11 TaxID=3425690 RepID=UPI003F881A76